MRFTLLTWEFRNTSTTLVGRFSHFVTGKATDLLARPDGALFQGLGCL